MQFFCQTAISSAISHKNERAEQNFFNEHMRIKLITCPSFARTLVSAIARSKNIIHTEILQIDSIKNQTDLINCNDKSVSTISVDYSSLNSHEGLIEFKIRLISMIHSAEENGFNAALVVFDNKCKHFLSGIKANKIPVVIPRTSLCDHNFCGYHSNNQRIASYLKSNEVASSTRFDSKMKLNDICHFIEKLNQIKNSNSLNSEELFGFWEQLSEAEAEWFGWDFEKVEPEYLLLQKSVDGFWSYDEFIVLMPGDQLVVDSEIGSIALKKAN